MKKKYSFFEKYSKELERNLRDLEVKYKIVGDGFLVPKYINFALIEGNISLGSLQQFTRSKPIVTNLFTHKELSDADYLTIRPQKNIIDITNSDEAFLYKCQRKTIWSNTRFEHKEQIRELRIKKNPSKSSTVFFTSTTGFSEIFAKKEVYSLFINNCISGVRFKSVILDGTSDKIESSICQLCSEKIIPINRIYINESQRISKCPICGLIKMIPSQDYQLQLIGAAFDYVDDFYSTDAVFGEGFSRPLYIVSQRLYQLVYKNKLCANVVFEPVLFVNEKHLNDQSAF